MFGEKMCWRGHRNFQKCPVISWASLQSLKTLYRSWSQIEKSPKAKEKKCHEKNIYVFHFHRMFCQTPCPRTTHIQDNTPYLIPCVQAGLPQAWSKGWETAATSPAIKLAGPRWSHSWQPPPVSSLQEASLCTWVPFFQPSSPLQVLNYQVYFSIVYYWCYHTI